MVIVNSEKDFSGDLPSYNSMNKQDLKRIVNKVENLPTIPVVATKILRMMSEEDPEIEDVVKVIEMDQAITMRLLKIVNSADKSLPAPINSVLKAALMIGFYELRCILLSVTVSESLIKPLKGRKKKDQEDLWRHSLACAIYSEMLAEKVCPVIKGEAFVSGLLHDIGKLILEECVPDKYNQLRHIESNDYVCLLKAEQDILGVDHSIVGKWLSEKWELPEIFTQAIWLHHHPMNAVLDLDFVKQKEIILIVNLANILAHEIMADSMIIYKQGADYNDILEYLNLKPEDLQEFSSSVGKRYSEKSSLLDMELKELSFYYTSLQRANKKLAVIASERNGYMTLEKNNRNLTILNDLNLELAGIEDSEKVLDRVVKTLASDFGKSEGVIYYLSLEREKLLGRCWYKGKPSTDFTIPLDKNNRPIPQKIPEVNDTLNRLIEECNSRFLKIADVDHKNNSVYYHKPYLMVPLIANGHFIGEICILEDNQTSGNALGETELKILRYIASLAAISLWRVHLHERVQETTETLSTALSKNTRLMLQFKQTKQMYLNLFEYSYDAIILYNKDGNIVHVNQRTIELLKYNKKDLINRSIFKILSNSAPETIEKILRKQWESNKKSQSEILFRQQNGKLMNLEITSKVVDQRSELVQSIIRDISMQKKAVKALVSEKERLATTLRSIGDGVITTDIDGKVELINRAAEILTGWTEEESVGKHINEIFHIIDPKTQKGYKNLVEEITMNGEPAGLFTKYPVLFDRIGTERIISINGALIREGKNKTIGVIFVFRDITQLKRMEEELLRTNKLESVSILAGGVAHDFNNILTGILGNINLAKIYSKPDDNVYERLIKAEKASLRAKDLIQQLLVFARGGAPIKQTASISELIKDSADFVLRGSNVQCEYFLADDLWLVEVDEAQISQVINNLIINAQQAMPEGGKIKVCAENITINKKDPEYNPCIGEGKYIRISIEDQGFGIPVEYIEKIFDPYFTTKEQGSGLGLAICYSIIKNHDGYINVKSQARVGTTFYIYLPSSQKETMANTNEEEILITGQGRILVMDDEEMVREIAGKMLTHIGYDVEFATNGHETIDLYKKAKGSGLSFDAVIMDLTIPGGMGGKEVIHELLEFDPEIKAIVSSGYSNDPIMEDTTKNGFSGIITKPYKIHQLSKTLYKVINRK